MQTVAPGVLRRTLLERIQDVNEALCGMHFHEAAYWRPRLLARMGISEEEACAEHEKRRSR